MNTLKLDLHGSVKPFTDFLKGFARIGDSLLLEVDTENKIFVSKVFTADKGSGRFSSIPFSECNITVMSDDGEEEREGARIKMGIFIQLDKFIKIIKRFGEDVDKDGMSHFSMNINYDYQISNNVKEFAMTSVDFKSSYLKMNIGGFSLSEFFFVSDDMFMNSIFNVEDPVKVILSANTISSIIKTSDIIKFDNKADGLEFIVDGTEFFVRDFITEKEREKNKSHAFEYKLDDLKINPGYELSAVINRSKFIDLMGNPHGDIELILGHRKHPKTGNYVVDRILFDEIPAEDSNMVGRSVIAIYNVPN